MDDHVDASATHALYSTSSDQRCPIGCSSADATAQAEQGDNGNGEPSSAKDIGKLPRQRLNSRSIKIMSKLFPLCSPLALAPSTSFSQRLDFWLRLPGEEEDISNPDVILSQTQVIHNER